MKIKFHHRKPDNPSTDLPLQLALHHANELGQIQRHNKSLELPTAVAATMCYFEDDDRNRLAVGYAFCSQKDQFSKKRGRMIAEGRARKQLRKDSR